MQQQQTTEAQLDLNGPMFSPGTVRYWYQDGGVFTILSHREDAYVGGESTMGEVATVTYPHQHISDWDLQAAITARVWFLTEWCKANNVTPYQA